MHETVFRAAIRATLLMTMAGAPTKVQVIAFEKLTTVQRFPGGLHDKPLTLRALVADGHDKPYVLGTTHEITDRLVVARRMFRVNEE